MDFFDFLRDYPAIGGTAIGAIFGAIFGVLGWTGKTAYELYIEKIRFKRDLKTSFWKEKINAAKKASEYYLEFLNLLNLARIQYENYESGKIEYGNLIKIFQAELVSYQEKLKAFPHFEHHHINIFYDFDQKKPREITDKIITSLREISELNPDTDNVNRTKELFEGLKKSYKELFDIHSDYVKIVREDLKVKA